MPELDIPQTGTTIASGTFGQPVVYRVVSRYASVAARDAETPSGAGETCYVQDIDEFQIWDGSAWVTYQPVVPLQTQSVVVAPGPGDKYFRGEYTWRDGQSATLSWYAYPKQTQLTTEVAFENAIPAGLQPPSQDLFVAGQWFNGSGLMAGQWGIRLRPDRSVFLERNDGVTNFGEVSRGTVSWVIGSDGTGTPT